ncbi:SIN component scaffold protein [Schizosaccharomyces japonicus yFS275]|uniref:SIN component scaffold protein n=1 Tax=Schizosaccharomyces japonicus (strain yFS275 / FY16936) TaxID=402676 RepID=B6JZZ9_SCHJY|nr:SIN component scaffold protein [Schizosaccharomyces japonicus yFS275]EEB06149.1 SIN component scaffold protein [Schizosaccharomyces japonicus yFS275]
MEQLWLDNDLSEEWIPRDPSPSGHESTADSDNPKTNTQTSSYRPSTAGQTVRGSVNNPVEEEDQVPQWRQVNAKNPIAKDIFARLDLESLFEDGNKNLSRPLSSTPKNNSNNAKYFEDNSEAETDDQEHGTASFHSNSPQVSPNRRPTSSLRFPRTAQRAQSMQFRRPSIAPDSFAHASSNLETGARRAESGHGGPVTPKSSSSSDSNDSSSSFHTHSAKGNSSPLKLFQGASDTFTREHLTRLAEHVEPHNSLSSSGYDDPPSIPGSSRISQPVSVSDRCTSFNTRDLYAEAELIMEKLRGRDRKAPSASPFRSRPLDDLQEEDEQDLISQNTGSRASQKFEPSTASSSRASRKNAPPAEPEDSWNVSSTKSESMFTGRSKGSARTAPQNSLSNKNKRNVVGPSMGVITPADLPRYINTAQGSMEFDRENNCWRRKSHESDTPLGFSDNESGSQSDASLSRHSNENTFSEPDLLPDTLTGENYEHSQSRSYPVRQAQQHRRLEGRKTSSLRTRRSIPSASFPANQNITLDETTEPSFSIQNLNGMARPVPFRNHLEATDQVNLSKAEDCSFSVSRGSIIRLLSKVEPYEPFWERIIQLDISRRHLSSIIGISDFCPAIEELSIEGNEIAYLTGCPSSVRSLNAMYNRLSCLTSFSHLANLQYLDISGNQLENLSSLSSLVHLRELRVDDNTLISLDGVQQLDGLLKLSARGNKLRSISFEGMNLHRLEELLLADNSIDRIDGLDSLKNLMVCNLDRNKLSNIGVSEPMHQLRTLRISHNLLSTFPVDDFPKLRTLYIDENLFKEIPSVHELRYLTNFSFCNQKPRKVNLTCRLPLDIKNLYISGNPLITFTSSGLFLNLKYLELVNVQMSQIPEDLPKLLPHLRVLDLSYNLLEDISPLKPLKMLHRLYLFGNKLKKVKPLCDTLANLHRLRALDLRQNPLNVHLYPYIEERSSLSPEKEKQEKPHRGRDHEQNARRRLSQKEWHELDLMFSTSMTENWRLRRSMYRKAINLACPKLQWLDGNVIHASEEDKGRTV